MSDVEELEQEEDTGEEEGEGEGEEESPDEDLGEVDPRRVFIGNLHYGVSWQDLKDWVNEEVGGASYVIVFRERARDGRRGRSKGSGMIEFESEEFAKQALDALNEKEFRDRVVFVRPDRGSRRPRRERRERRPRADRDEDSDDDAPPRRRGQQSRPRPRRRTPPEDDGDFEQSGRAIFIGNLNFDTEEDTLQEKLATYGTLLSVAIPRRHGGRSKGFALAEFETTEGADEAIAGMNQEEFDGRVLLVRLDKMK